MHGQIRRRGDRSARKLARHPDFMQVAKARVPGFRNFWKFPRPIPDDAAAAQACAPERPQCARQKRRIVMDDERAAGAGDDRPARRSIDFGLAEGAADIEGRRRQAGGFERVISEAGAFADTAHGRKQPGYRDRKPAARHAIGNRGKEPADVRKNLCAPVLRQALPQPPQRMTARRLASGCCALGRSRLRSAKRGTGQGLNGRVHRSIPRQIQRPDTKKADKWP